MAHLAFTLFPGTGHFNPLSTLAGRLQSRGHRISFLSLPDLRPRVEKAGFNFLEFGRAEYPPGAVPAFERELGRRTGIAAMRFTINGLRSHGRALLGEGPALVKGAGVDALVLDQVELAGSTLADLCGLPFVTACAAMPINLDASVPFFGFHSPHLPTALGRLRNSVGNAFIRHLTRPGLRAISRYRRTRGLPPLHRAEDAWSSRAQVTQLPAALDFPRRNIPPAFHHTGPFLRVRPALSDAPGTLIYASMGTLQNGLTWLFQAIVDACRDVPLPVTISTGGGGLNPAELRNVPAHITIVPYAPQLELLQQAALCITHAGLNTTLEALACGVPLVAIPITNDQPGVAARILHHHLGLRVLPRRSMTPALRTAIQTVLTTPTYTRNARALQRHLLSTDGADQAATLIERALALAERN